MSHRNQKKNIYNYTRKNFASNNVFSYLKSRGIDEEIIKKCIENNLIYEEKYYHNAVFVGYDEQKNIRYAGCRSTNEKTFKADAIGSDKTYGTMKNLVRTKQGIFSLEDSYTLEDIQNDNYKLLTIREVLPNIPVTIIEGDTLKKVQNGMSLPIFFNSESSLLIDKKGREIAIYKKEGNMDKPYKMIEVNNE